VRMAAAPRRRAGGATAGRRPRVGGRAAQP
jgi:hypothetical protein